MADICLTSAPPGAYSDARTWLIQMVDTISEIDRFRVLTSASAPNSATLTALWGSCDVPDEAMVLWRKTGAPDRALYVWSIDVGDWELVNSYPSSNSTPTGTLIPFAGDETAAGALSPTWLLCYGQEVSRATYAGLFTAIGTAYGVGDGSTTFNLPDFRGRIPSGKDNIGGSSANRVVGAQADSLGGAMGSETQTLTTAQLAAHTHGVAVNGNVQTGSSPFVEVSGGNTGGGGGGTVANKAVSNGSGSAHNNMQPTLFVNYLIKT